jgi:hypothetical protein
MSQQLATVNHVLDGPGPDLPQRLRADLQTSAQVVAA